MNTRYRLVNPLLGVYYGIFTAAFIGLGLVLLILEYMGQINGALIFSLPMAAVFLSGAIAVASMSRVREEFFISGRRVPSGLNGLAILVIALGGAGLSGLFGAMYFWGTDGFGLLFGVFVGVLMSGVLFAGFVRKAGGYTLPAFFELRYNNRMIGVTFALLLSVPAICFALGELSLIKTVMPALLGVTPEIALLLTGCVVLLMLLPGGVRSMSWSQCALAIVLVIGLVVPLVLVALKYTNLPLAPFTYGSLIDDLATFEALGGDSKAGGVSAIEAVVGGEPVVLQHSFLGGLRPLDLFDKLAMFFLMAGGVAAMPALVMRAGVASTAFQARKSYAWGAALIGFVVLTVPAYVIFFRYMLFDPQVNIITEALPAWITTLQSMGLISIEDGGGDGRLTGADLHMARDGIFLGLPMIAEYFEVLQSLTVAALLSAALAGLLARVMGLSLYLVRDFHLRKEQMEADVFGMKSLLWGRLAIVLVMLGLVGLSFQFHIDPFQSFMAGILFCALGVFPFLLLSVWVNRFSVVGVLVGSVSGFLLAGWILFVTEIGRASGPMGLDLFGLGFAGMLLMLVYGLVIAQFSRRASDADRERLNDIRTPGGEAIYDRHLRNVMPRRTPGRG